MKISNFSKSEKHLILNGFAESIVGKDKRDATVKWFFLLSPKRRVQRRVGIVSLRAKRSGE